MLNIHYLTCAILALTIGTISAVEPVRITIDGAKQYQHIRGFGTCGVAPEKTRQQAADCYITDLRLNVVRMPLEPFVLEGENPYGIATTLTPAMVADPKQITYRAFLWKGMNKQPDRDFAWIKALKQRNPALFVIASVWSPPHWMKESGPTPKLKLSWKTGKHGTDSLGGRLNPAYRTHFAHYLAEWVIGLREVYGVTLSAISIQNELYFSEPYDSCVYTPAEYAATLAEVARIFAAKGLKTQFFGPEDMTKESTRVMGYVRAALKDPLASKALSVIATHGYSDGVKTSLGEKDSASLWSLLQKEAPGRESWMTETEAGHAGWLPAEPIRRYGPTSPLMERPGAMAQFGRMLHNALVYGNTSLWSTWQFVDKESFVASDRGAGLMFDLKDRLQPTKKYQIQKHYSRFISPGSFRIAAGPDAQQDVLVSAYRDPKDGAVAIVVQNHSAEAQDIRLTFQNISPMPAKWQVVVTDARRDCEAGDPIITANGLVTLHLVGHAMATLSGKGH